MVEIKAGPFRGYKCDDEDVEVCQEYPRAYNVKLPDGRMGMFFENELNFYDD